MRKVLLLGAAFAVALVAVGGSYAVSKGGGGNGGFKAMLNGYQETPSISTVARGQFSARLEDGKLKYTLSYRGLEGGNTLFAHIHFGQRHTAGGVSTFLCGGSPPASDKGPCPNGGGVVQGEIDADDVIGPAGQGIAARELHELLDAMRVGATYVNVHTQTYPNGEIRGQIVRGFKRGHDDGDGRRKGRGGNDDDD